jgi:tetratricopeptide (TPR) repeat protein
MDRSRRRAWLLRALTALLGAFAAVPLLGAAELALRLARPRPPGDAPMDRYLAQQRDHMRRCDVGSMFRGARAGQRVVVLGESSALMLGNRLTELALRPGSGVAVANCGDNGSGLVHVERRFDEAMAVRPDAVVVVFGHNYGYAYPRSPWELTALELRRGSRLLGLLDGQAAAPPMICETEAPPPGPLGAALRRMGDEARRRGVRLVITTVAPNLLLPPRCDRAAGLLDGRVYRARFLRARGRAAEARALLSAAAAGRSARAEFELGVDLAADGDPAAARDALGRALADDRHPGRASRAVNDVIRAAARAGGARLRDTAARVEARTPDGIVGWESERDECHLHWDLFLDEAVAVLDLLGVRAPAPPPVDPQDRPAAVLDYVAREVRGPDPRLRTEPGAIVVALWRLVALRGPAVDDLIAAWPDRAPAFTERERGYWLAGAAEAYRLAGQPGRARDLRERAVALAGDVPLVWIWRGLAAVGEGRDDDARAAFARALALSPGQAEARAYLALL